MAFDQINVVRDPAAGVIDAAHGAQLSFAVRGQQVAPHVIGNTDTMDQTVNWIFLPQGIGETL